MNIQLLKQTILQALKVDKTFSLSASALGFPPSTTHTLLSHLLKQPILILDNASVNTSGDQPFAEGTLISEPVQAYSFLQGFYATAIFSLDSSNVVQMQLKLKPQPDKIANWGLPDALPRYKATFFANFVWSNAQFDFDSSTPASLPTTFPQSYGFNANSDEVLARLQKGMAFQADLAYTGSDAGLQWLLGGTRVHIAGSIEWDGNLPRMDLVSNPLQSLTLEGFTLPIKFHLIAVLAEVPATTSSSTQLLSLSLGLVDGPLGTPQGSQHFTIPFYVQLYSDPVGQVTVVGNFIEASTVGLNDVAALLGVHSLDSQQANGFPILQGLALQNIKLTVETARQQLILASATVGFTPPNGPWQPFGSNLLAFDGLTITFTVVGPFSSPSFETSIACQAGLAGGTLDAWISLPSLDFACELHDGATHPIDLTKIVNGITGNAFTTATPNFKLLCTELTVLGNASANIYRFQATVQDDWQVDVLGAKFALSSIGFDITHQAGQNAATTGMVVAQLLIADVPVQIFAEYKDSQQGWSFSGGTIGTQSISLKTLVDDAFKLFGLSLPGNIPQITITDLQMMIQTDNMDFGFSCEGTVQIAGELIVLDIDLGRVHDDPTDLSKATIVFMGYLTIRDQTFEVDFTSGETDKILSFKWVDHTGRLQLADIASMFGVGDLPQIPSSFDLALVDALLSYDFTKKVLFLETDSANYEKADFIALKNQQQEWQFVFGIGIRKNINLSNLPLVGQEFSVSQTISIDDLQLLIASKDFTQQEVIDINKLLPKTATKLPEKPKVGDGKAGTGNESTAILLKGLSVVAKMQFGGATDTLFLPVSATTTQPISPNQPAFPSSTSTSPADNTKWFTLQKTFGPVHFERIGIQYKDAALWFLLDAALSAAGLTLSLDGLSIGSPLSKFEPKFNLNGIGIDYRGSSALEIGGAFLKVADNEYDGTAIIKTEELTISAIGSYTELNGHPSLFIYATLDHPIGGPAFFFVTGLAAGFGYNRTLKLPSIEQVAQFPLVAEAINAQNPNITGLTSPPTPLLPGEGSQTPPFPASIGAQGGLGQPDIITQKLQTLKQYIPPATGEIFLAVGIKFTSFKMVDSFALLTLAFGNRFQLNLLGISTLIAPTPETGKIVTPLAEVQLALKATFIPADGILQVQAQLTPNSYLFSRNCHLTGGFAFYTWFGNNPHTGDFILTLGGYHPNYQVPTHYPQVPRLGFNWQVDEHLSLKGDAYYALTPSALMAGGHLQATWESGNLKAWFNAGADFLIAWKPYHYEAHIYVDLGASYTFTFFGTHTITVDVGADLQIWGPEFSGKAQIHLWIISFDVTFGNSASPQPQPIGWDTFKASFLPANDQICSIAVKDGLVTKPTQDTSDLGVINPKHFTLITNSVIPSKQAFSEAEEARYGQISIVEANTNFGIASMAATDEDITSTHIIIITRNDQHIESQFEYIPILKDVPTGIWGQSPKPNLNDDPFVKNALSGFEIRPKQKQASGKTVAIERSKLQDSLEPIKNVYEWKKFRPFTSQNLTEQEKISKIKESIINNPARNQLLTNLGFNPKDIGLNSSIADNFLVAPQVETVV